MISAMSELVVTTYEERPEYAADAFAMPDTWPEFMGHDEISYGYLPGLLQAFPHLNLVGTVDGRMVARALAAPIALHTERRRGELPSGGWDRVVVWAFQDHAAGARTDTVSALEIAVHPDHLGAGVSHAMLAALRTTAAAAGYGELVAPVRPNGKFRHPEVSMQEYAALTRDDGLPTDAWLRTHVRAGATVDSVAPRSMVIAGTLQQWRDWTGLPFDTDGDVVVPGALVPVHCRATHDYAVYVEPNVWVRHRL
jgi:GNAT superfamily N-acetyltransferase